MFLIGAVGAALLHVAAAASASPTVLVTGATGKTGSLLFKMLKSKGIEVRGLVRNVTKARQVLNCTGCDASEGIFVGDITKKETLVPAMQGATALAIVTSAIPQCKGHDCFYPKGAFPVDIDWHGGKAQVTAFAEAQHGFQGPVVMCSSMGTTEPDSFLEKLGNGHIGFFKLNMEAFLMSSGLPFTIVKPCGLIDTPPSLNELVVGHDDEMHLQPPTVSRADVARVLTEALTNPALAAGLRFDLCSRAGAPTRDVAQVLASARYPWNARADEVVV
mmetsp:Transcript_49397/g.143197  ORF Transcript_49397/g.143197 Transcript_49397/m.143197 type:complete len:275 (-) Transcript_49397:145-969(-)